MLQKLAAVAISLSAIVGFVFMMLPRWRPQPAPEKYGANVKITSIEPGVTFDEQFSQMPVVRLGGSTQYYEKYKGQKGVVLRFEAGVRGERDAEYPLYWTVYEAESKKRSDDSALRRQPAWPTVRVKTKGTDTQVNGETWVLSPRQPGKYFVRLELVDPERQTPLGYADSEAFVIP